MRFTAPIRYAAVLALLGLALSAPTQAQTTYVVPSLSDFSGPFSTVMPSIGGGREAVVKWWNAEVGAKQGIVLQLKAYDTRFETAQTASLWPGILAEKPLVGFSLAGPDTAALQQRLPNDKVVMFSASASNGFAWRPNQWILSLRPTFAHEFVGFVDWFHKTKGEGKRPVKVAMVTSESSPSYVDVAKGMIAFAKANPKVVELVEVVYAEAQPADLTLQMRRVTNAGAEVILAPASIQQAIAIKRALAALNKKVPVAFAMHNAPTFIAKPMGGIQTLEGDYETQGGALSTDDDTEVKRFYDMLTAKYGLKAPWNGVTIGGIAQSLLLVRAVEAAAKKHGPDKLTGELIHTTLLETTFTSASLQGYASDIKYDISAPFPATNIKVNIGTVKDGKLVPAVLGYAVPKMDLW
ncbi:ABC transporter substrate-binding protein [Variovorax paradoxus]|nr:ABC transporter substrate-binding protein [Variovorax paradoxus]MBT2302015.1 ABC transporter substrate-binding protein [Variovorax paradoxus]